MQGMMLCCTLIDHFDSFTYSIVAWLEEAGAAVRLVNYRQVGADIWAQGDFTVLSPGPGHPAEYEKTLAALGGKPVSHPVFGICLGMQIMLYQASINCTPIPCIMHGKAAGIAHNGQDLFQGLPPGFRAGQYNSLGTAECPPGFTVIARDGEGMVQGVVDKSRCLMGVQFHPESFLTEHRSVLAANLLRWVGRG
ncbi:MAG: hypothetical protein B0D92_07510 [Spirochaeta sp. LUC14_002_19_P3]|nr:MAG: hypothetical protein B0D92_07510 [Spirochaeta sp. LUC14_002_19_P3]